jgi:hypothetical protein
VSIKVGDEVYIESWTLDSRYACMYGEVTDVDEYLGEYTYTVYFSEIDETSSFGQDSVVAVEDDRGEVYE